MRKILWLLFLLTVVFDVQAQQASVEKLESIIYTLADDSLRGRKSGSEDALKAADYIAENYSEMGLAMWSGKTYFSDFEIDNHRFRNVLGIIEGGDPVLKNEYIVVGAHFDHLGMSKKKGQEFDDDFSYYEDDYIYNGADDNASGTAAVMELARMLLANREHLKRSIIIANFDGEEVGLLGSDYLANHCFVPIEDVKLMLSIDMVGYLGTSHFLKYVGVETIDNGKNLFKAVPWNVEDGKIELRNFENSIFTATDTRGFATLGVPTLYVTTGMKSPYHKVSDEADGIDYYGLAKVTDHLFGLVSLCASDADLKSSGKVAPIHGGKSSQLSAGYMLSLGSSRLKYHEGPLTGKKAFDFSLGLYSRLYFVQGGLVSLRADAVYEHFVTSTELGIFKSHTATFPARFEFHLPIDNFGSLYISAGAYYRYFFAAKLDDEMCNFSSVSHDDFGWLWSIGLNVMDGFFIEGTSYYGLQNPIRDAAIKMNNRTGILSVGKRF